MATININIEGLENLLKDLSALDINQRVAIGLVNGASLLDETLEKEVANRYTFPKKLSSVRTEGDLSINSKSSGGTSIHQDLTYTGTRFPLAEFDNSIETLTSSPKSYFYGNYYDKKGIFERYAPLEVVKIAIKRGEFKQINRTDVKAFKAKGKILTRRNADQDKYKKLYINGVKNPDYTRTDLKQLFGPSLPEAATWVYENNKVVQDKIDEIPSLILKELMK